MPPELETVLLIDDDPFIRQVATLALEQVGGLDIDSVASGAEALATLQHRVPDLILLDVMMPEMDGPATLERLRLTTDTSSVPVIFLTGKTVAAERERLVELGAIGVLAKPFDPMTLAELVQELWDTHHGG